MDGCNCCKTLDLDAMAPRVGGGLLYSSLLIVPEYWRARSSSLSRPASCRRVKDLCSPGVGWVSKLDPFRNQSHSEPK